MGLGLVTEADIAEGGSIFDLTDGTNSSRANVDHRATLGRNWELRWCSIGVSAGNGPCPCAIVIDARGTGGQTLKRGVLRGAPLSGGLGTLSVVGRIPLKKDGSIFFLVRNDTGETVTVGFNFSGVFLEDR